MLFLLSEKLFRCHCHRKILQIKLLNRGSRKRSAFEKSVAAIQLIMSWKKTDRENLIKKQTEMLLHNRLLSTQIPKRVFNTFMPRWALPVSGP